MSENSRRDQTITIRATKAEKEKLLRKAAQAKLSLTDYLLSLSERQIIQPAPDLAPVLRELKRIGSNINQIATKVNSGMRYVTDMREVTEGQKKICELLLQMAGDERWRR